MSQLPRMSLQAAENSVSTRSRRRHTSESSNISLSDVEPNELSDNKLQIANSVCDSSDVRISNSSNNVYNAPVTINNIFQNCNQIEDSISKTSYSAFWSRARQICTNKKYIIILVLLLIMIALIVTLVMWLYNPDSSQSLDAWSPSNNTSNNLELSIVSKEEWNATPPKFPPDPFKIQPLPLVIISHTETMSCDTEEQCTEIVRKIQMNHMLNWNDIGYNFLVSGDGLVYEGRGWCYVGAHAAGYNQWSIGLSLIGRFTDEEPTKVQLQAAQSLIAFGVKNGTISDNYKLLAHRDCRNTDSPGDKLYNIIKTWPHWSQMCSIK